MTDDCIPNLRKAAVIGCGFVGAATAFTLMQSKMFSELVLIDVNKAKAEGEAMDISAGIPFAGQMQIYAGDYPDLADAALVILAAGANQKPGESRLDLIQKNFGIFKSIVPQITAQDFKGTLLVISNPVDILTYAALKLSGLPENRVIGSGTVLDTARLRYALSEHLGVDSQSIHAFIVGEHGDSEIAAWSSANVAGMPLKDFCAMRGHKNFEAASQAIAQNVRDSAYEIIERKQATYYGIAMSVEHICECIIRDKKSILPVSSVLHGEYGINGLCMSLPVILGADGAEMHVPLNLSTEEQEQLEKSAAVLQDIASKLDFS